MVRSGAMPSCQRSVQERIPENDIGTRQRGPSTALEDSLRSG